ncbi:hypothetical protein EXIGLDRAFT_839438 [Exidia glandulosa HHB12029]|uniref:Uncharacterized protein n=1 Tax=Exidia glandulosa HHB12029 TaxID=1314781 RepID=A0A165F1H3_EXIGL|nr:hypothetical protein EXIGLDRAFT_839438 [Exidia glandulosa HHB12029]
MSTRMQLVNDTIVAVGKPFEEYTPREHHVRDAMFILTCALPLLGTGLVLLARDGWWKAHARLSIQTVGAAWLASITAFGIMIYAQHCITTRSTFILAVFHEQVEVLLDCVLLGLSARRSFAYTWGFGFVLLLAVLVIPTMSTVFMTAAIIGGGNDALIVLLFLYGKQYWFALGALGHLASAILVFTEVIRNIGVVPYNALIFISVWIHAGCTVMGIWQLQDKYHEYEGALVNPLGEVKFSKRTLLYLSIFAITGSTGVTLFLAYILPAL